MPDRPAPQPSPRFATTRWSLVLSAKANGTPASQAALADLCVTYWYPLYAFLRRSGTAEADAGDLVQGFVARLLEKGDVDATPERGRFRSYLLGALQNHAANVRRAQRAAARGGGRSPLSLDFGDAAGRYAHEPVDVTSPRALFERRWALTILERALERLGEEYRARGRGPLFEALRETLTGQETSVTYADHARALGVSESAIKVTVHRLRARMRELVRDEIAQTVASEADIDDELQHLFEALAT